MPITAALHSPRAPIAQLAEAADLKSVQCRFESDWGHRDWFGECAFGQVARVTTVWPGAGEDPLVDPSLTGSVARPA